MQQVNWLCVAIASFAVYGCSGELHVAPSDSESSARSLARLVAPNVLKFITKETFVIPNADLRRSVDREATSSEAVRIANAFGSAFPGLRMLERMRGTKLKQRKIWACETPRYAASRFDLSNTRLSYSLQRAFGPYWIVVMCDAVGSRVAVFAVSAIVGDYPWTNMASLAASSATDVGNLLDWAPLNGSTANYAPMEPESGVRALAAITGGVLDRRPELLSPDPRDASPTNATWLVQMTTVRTVRDGQDHPHRAARFEIGSVLSSSRISSRLELRLIVDDGSSPARGSAPSARDVAAPPFREGLSESALTLSESRSIRQP